MSFGSTRGGGIVSTYARNYDKISLGIFDPASDAERDDVDRYPDVEAVLRQPSDHRESLDATLDALADAVGFEA